MVLWLQAYNVQPLHWEGDVFTIVADFETADGGVVRGAFREKDVDQEIPAIRVIADQINENSPFIVWPVYDLSSSATPPPPEQILVHPGQVIAA